MFTSCLCVWMELSFWTRAWTERELTLVRNPARVCQSHSSALSPSLPVNVCWAGTKYVQQFTCVFLSLWASDVLTRSHTFLVPVAVFIVFLPLKKDSQCSEWKCFIRYAVLCVLCTSELFFSAFLHKRTTCQTQSDVCNIIISNLQDASVFLHHSKHGNLLLFGKCCCFAAKFFSLPDQI